MMPDLGVIGRSAECQRALALGHPPNLGYPNVGHKAAARLVSPFAVRFYPDKPGSVGVAIG